MQCYCWCGTMAPMPDFSLPNLTNELPNISTDNSIMSDPDEKTVSVATMEPTSSAVNPKPNQIPTWAVVLVVVVMVCVPVLLFALGGKEDNSSTAESTALSPSPTRTELVTPTRTPTPKTTPSVELTPSLLASTPTPVMSATPTQGISPTNASQSNLMVEEIYFEDPQSGQKLDGQLYAGQHVSLRAKVKNNGTADAKNIVSYWKYQGNLVGKNSNGTLRAGSSAVYDDINSLVYSGIFLKEGDVTIAYFLDPDNALGEANITDNSKSLTSRVNPTRTDLEVMDIELYHPQTGEKITTPSIGQQVLVKPVIKNLGQEKQTNIDVKWHLQDTEVKRITSKQWLSPGESIVVSEGYQHTFAGGTTKFKASVNPDKTLPETNSGNNERVVEFKL